MNTLIGPREAAKRVKRRYKGQIDSNMIRTMIRDFGYEVIHIDRNRSSSVDMLLNSLEVTIDPDAFDAMCCRRGSAKLVLVASWLGESETAYVLAHELGHITLGHMAEAGYSVEEERDANEFAHYLLEQAPLVSFSAAPLRWIAEPDGGRRKAAVIAGIAALLLAIAGMVNLNRYIAENSYYVTTSGSKYHVRDCRIIKGRKNIRRINKDEIQGYEPCGICIGL